MNDAFKDSFLGTGWGFPPTFRKEKNGVVMSSGVSDINESLEILLATRIGERVMLPKYGCNLKDFLFESMSLSMVTLMKTIVEESINLYEPRIKLLKVEVEQEVNEGRLEFHLTYEVRGTNTRFNYVYPFYLEEGTELEKQK